MNQVEDFIGEVNYLPDELHKHKTPIKEEKALLIDAAKQLQGTINKGTPRNQ